MKKMSTWTCQRMRTMQASKVFLPVSAQVLAKRDPTYVSTGIDNTVNHSARYRMQVAT